MKIDQVLQTYDERYATEYNDTFLTDVWVKNSRCLSARRL